MLVGVGVWRNLRPVRSVEKVFRHLFAIANFNLHEWFLFYFFQLKLSCFVISDNHSDSCGARYLATCSRQTQWNELSYYGFLNAAAAISTSFSSGLILRPSRGTECSPPSPNESELDGPSDPSSVMPGLIDSLSP